MLRIQCSNPTINYGKWFTVWSEELHDGEPINVTDYLKQLVRVEWRPGVQYRIIVAIQPFKLAAVINPSHN